MVSKVVTSYCEPWSARAGESVALMASSHVPCDASLRVVRLSCGDRTRHGPGFSEHAVPSHLPSSVRLDHQPIVPGSYGTIDLDGIRASRSLGLRFSVMTTRPTEPQTCMSLSNAGDAIEVIVREGVLMARVCGSEILLRSTRLANRRWYDVELDIDLSGGALRSAVATRPSVSPGRDLMEVDEAPVRLNVGLPDILELRQLTLGGTTRGGDFDGRIANPRLVVDDAVLQWDLSTDMRGNTIVEMTGAGRDGQLHQLPARAVTGPTWDGSQQRWTDDPSQWDAVHFHKDDLYDAEWTTTATFNIPVGLPSGIYAFLLETEHGDDRVPFFVRPAADEDAADIALLISSATYLAYANHRMLFEGADFIRTRSHLRPEHEYVREHPEVGLSMYEKHPDGSGVMYSSRRRPVLNLRPGADGWNFTPDTDINAFLENLDVGHDVLSDEDVHLDGLAALEPYRVIVTCTHPEYWSTAMLDALEGWQRQGGRLIYLGGNGFYWRVAFSDSWPGAMELRMAEDGVRNWQTENGESYHSFTGEYGGMWRRLGRAPNEIAGVGFAAQGFDKASHYEINDASRRSRAAWIWQGVGDDGGRIGTSGLGGGAAGQELDRYDTRLGSPEHAVVLASAVDFGPDMVRTKEEFEGSVVYPTPDPLVRSDIVFYETPAGGAVFSVGSISWFGALARDGYDNDVAQMTANVVRRFLDPEPFVAPAAGSR